jgi:hypothetical protein
VASACTDSVDLRFFCSSGSLLPATQRYYTTLVQAVETLRNLHFLRHRLLITTFNKNPEAYTADENGAEVTNHGPAEMPAYVAKRLNGSKNRFKKKGTPAEREAAVEARRQAVLTEKKNKARKYIDKVETYGKMAAAAAAEANNFEGKMQENMEFSEKCEQ